jgi:CheY-like chemotaxis protein
VNQHAGTIAITSAVGVGTTVTIMLLQSSADVPDIQHDITRMALPRGTETILLVEDEPAVRTLAARVLRSCGYTVLEASDGDMAVQVAQTYLPAPIHLLLSDVVMPHLSGPAAAAQIRTHYPAIAMRFMSGHPDRTTPSLTTQLPDMSLIHKPFSAFTLATAVRTALDADRDHPNTTG